MRQSPPHRGVTHARAVRQRRADHAGQPRRQRRHHDQVSSTTGFPASGNFRVRIDNEILLVTAVAGTTWTVTRAAEAVAGVQTATAHAQGATVTHVPTAASVQLTGNGVTGLNSLTEAVTPPDAIFRLPPLR